MPFEFNKEFWNIGRKIEDNTLPIINKYYDCNFKRDESNIFDILDFNDEDKKIIVEIKGRRIKSNAFKDTIITTNKVSSGFQKIEEGYKVYFIFVFTDKILEYELKINDSFKVKLTGTNTIPHYLIPVSDLKEIN